MVEQKSGQGLDPRNIYLNLVAARNSLIDSGQFDDHVSGILTDYEAYKARQMAGLVLFSTRRQKELEILQGLVPPDAVPSQRIIEPITTLIVARYIDPLIRESADAVMADKLPLFVAKLSLAQGMIIPNSGFMEAIEDERSMQAFDAGSVENKKLITAEFGRNLSEEEARYLMDRGQESRRKNRLLLERDKTGREVVLDYQQQFKNNDHQYSLERLWGGAIDVYASLYHGLYQLLPQKD